MLRTIKSTFFRTICEKLALMRSLARITDGLLILSGLYLVCFTIGQPWSELYLFSGLLGALLFGILAELSGVYSTYRDENISGRVGRIWSAWAISVAILLMIGFMTKVTSTYSRIITMAWMISAPMLVSVWHAFVGLVLRTMRADGLNTKKAVIAGVTEMSAQLAKSISQKPWLGIDIVGHYEDRNVERRPEGSEALGPFLGNHRELVESAQRGEIDVVYIALPMRAESRIAELTRQLGRTTTSIYIAHDFSGFNLLSRRTAPRWSQLGDVSVLGIVESPYNGLMGAVKQFEDVLIGSVLLAIAAVPMIGIALAIKLTSKGPVFFKQTRYGLNGEKINVLKFRSMTVMENGDDVRQATKGDERITPLGAFLRKTSMDELPQFLHVITGKMSLVGPRPHAVAHNEQYRKVIDHYMVRHKVKPGITGLAQVNGCRGETDTDEKMQKRVEYDLRYIREWTPLLDLKIIFLTVFGRKTRENAV